MAKGKLPKEARERLDSLAIEVTEEQLDDLLAGLIAADTRTPPGDCRAIVPACARWLDRVGLRHRVAAAEETLPNVLVEVGSPSDKAALCWNSHIDTVAPGDLGDWRTDPLVATEIDGMVYGLGVVNCKGGAAVQLCAALALVRSGLDLSRGLVVVLEGDEETFGDRGLGYLFKERIIRPVASLTDLPSNNMLVYAERGVAWIKVTVHGVAAHGAMPHEGKNAIGEAARLVAMLDTELVPQLSERRAPHVPSSSMNIGVIEGGESPNVVAPSCSFTMDRRIVPGETPEGAVAEVKELCSAEAAKRGFTVTIEELQGLHPYASSADSDLARSLKMAGDELGLPVRDGESAALCDGRHAADGTRQVVSFGPGDIAASHGPNERVAREELVQAVRVLTLSGALLIGGEEALL